MKGRRFTLLADGGRFADLLVPPAGPSASLIAPCCSHLIVIEHNQPYGRREVRVFAVNIDAAHQFRQRLPSVLAISSNLSEKHPLD